MHLQFTFLGIALWPALKALLNYKVAILIAVPAKKYTSRTCPTALRLIARAELRTISPARPVAIQPMPNLTRRGTSLHPGLPGPPGNTKRLGLTHLHNQERRHRPLQRPVKSTLR